MNHFFSLSHFCSLILIPFFLTGQLPNTNIYVMNLRANEEIVLLDKPTLVSGFNLSGYNNQPSFLAPDRLYITSDFESLGLTDILQLDLDGQKITRITATEESEYSPTPMPDRANFSVVRQELDDSQPVPQSLWSYPIDRSHSGSLLIPDLFNIGYHAWINEEKVALFLVEDPVRIVVYDLANQNTTHVGSNIGRCLKIDADGNLYYIQLSETGSEIRKYDVYLGRSRKVIDLSEGQQDFDILPNGHLIIGKDSRLLTLKPFRDREWKEVMNLTSAGIQKITRISSVQGKVAIVTSSAM